MCVRAAVQADVSAIKAIIDSTEIFPSELVDAMIQPYLDGSSQEEWLVHCIQDQVAAVAFLSPEKVGPLSHL